MTPDAHFQPLDMAAGEQQQATSAAAALPRPAARAWKPLLKTGAIGFVGGVLLWGVGDVVGELTTFIRLQQKGLALANDSQELKDQIGHPWTPGAWYDAKIGFTAGGSIAQITFKLQGSKQITDITVRGLRGGGWVNRALYNTIGPGQWQVVDCTAMFPSGGGLVQPRSLLPATAHSKGGGKNDDINCSTGACPTPVNRDTADTQASQGASQASRNATQTAVAGGQQSAAGPSRTWWQWLRGRKPSAGIRPDADSRHSANKTVSDSGPMRQA